MYKLTGKKIHFIRNRYRAYLRSAVLPFVLLVGFTLVSCNLSDAGQTVSSDSISSNTSTSGNDMLSGNYMTSGNLTPTGPQTYTLSAPTAPSSLTVVIYTEGDTVYSNPVLPETVTYYKSGYRSSSYENVTFTYENGAIVLWITPDISDADLTNAHLAFTLPENLLSPEIDDNSDNDNTSEYNNNTGSSNEASQLYDNPGCFFENPLLSSDSDSTEDDLTEDNSVDKPDYITEDGGINLTMDPILYLIDYKGNITSYPLVVQRQTFDIPTLFLTTDTGEDITSRDEYVSGNLVLDGVEYEVSIRGRGNASWWKFAQKSYMLRFDEEISFFGMLPSEKWVLASTYGDLSLIRNCVAMEISGFMENLEYTPAQIPVDVYLNGEYLGVYTFSEKIEVDMDKIDLFSRYDYRTLLHRQEPDIAFLLECGGDLFNQHVIGQEYFYTSHSPRLFLEYPEFDTPYTEDFQYIEDYMNQVDRAFVRGYGYEEYIDIDSWVDWFIVMELTNNTDSAFCRSSFLYKRPGERLRLGPVWDFDMAFGNFYYDNQTYAYWATAEPIYAPAQNHYMTYLYESDAFMLAVRERWDEVKEDLLAVALEAVTNYGDMVAASRVYNNHVRGVSNSGYQVTQIANFIQRRYDWIDMSIHMSDFNRHPATESVPRDEEEVTPLLDENGNPIVMIADENGNIIFVDINGNPIVVSANTVEE